MIGTMRSIESMQPTIMQQQRSLPLASGIHAGILNGTMKTLRLTSAHISANRSVSKSNRACVITCSLNNTTSAPGKLNLIFNHYPPTPIGRLYFHWKKSDYCLDVRFTHVRANNNIQNGLLSLYFLKSINTNFLRLYRYSCSSKTRQAC